MPARLGTWQRQDTFFSRGAPLWEPKSDGPGHMAQIKPFCYRKSKKGQQTASPHQLFQFLMSPVDADHYYCSDSNLFLPAFSIQLILLHVYKTNQHFVTPNKCRITNYSLSFLIEWCWLGNTEMFKAPSNIHLTFRPSPYELSLCWDWTTKPNNIWSVMALWWSFFRPMYIIHLIVIIPNNQFMGCLALGCNNAQISRMFCCKVMKQIKCELI